MLQHRTTKLEADGNKSNCDWGDISVVKSTWCSCRVLIPALRCDGLQLPVIPALRDSTFSSDFTHSLLTHRETCTNVYR